MDKYASLERKLSEIKKHLGELVVYGDATKSYVANYERYVDDLIELVHNRKIQNSNGALLGLGRGLSVTTNSLRLHMKLTIITAKFA